MKKIGNMTLIFVLVMILNACFQQNLILEGTRDFVQSIRKDFVEEFPPTVAYDNETSAETLSPISLERAEKEFIIQPHYFLREKRGTTTYWAHVELEEDQVLLRYNYGKYYSIAKVKEGGYVFSLYSSEKNLQQEDSCHITKLASAEKFNDLHFREAFSKVQPLDPDMYVEEGVTRVNKKGEQETECFDTTHRLDNLVTLTLRFGEDGKIWEYQTEVPNFSVLTYLLPQDLELIS